MNVDLSLASFDYTQHDQAALTENRWENESEFFEKAAGRFAGSLLLQTCNRVEILVHGSEDELRSFLKDEGRTGFIFFSGDDALLHLSRLAAGTESLIVGEDQILGQLKNALLHAEEAGAADAVISSCITTAIRLGVTIRRKTSINRGAVSIGSAAVLLAEDEIGDLTGKNILVVGGGEMGRLVTKSLAEKNLRAIYVTNRTYENARVLAYEIGGRAMHLDQLYPCIALSDVVISCTAAPHEIIRRGPLAAVMDERFWPLDPAPRKLVIIDIAQPADVEKECSEIPGVNLFTIDDLRGISRRNMESRRAETRHAEEIVCEYLPEFVRIIDRTAAGDVLASLYSWAEEIRCRECARAIHRLKSGGDAESIIAALSSSLTKKLLEDAGSVIRRAAEGTNIEQARRLVSEITTTKRS